jgi:hypothetical protein
LCTTTNELFARLDLRRATDLNKPARNRFHLNEPGFLIFRS